MVLPRPASQMTAAAQAANQAKIIARSGDDAIVWERHHHGCQRMKLRRQSEGLWTKRKRLARIPQNTTCAGVGIFGHTSRLAKFSWSSSTTALPPRGKKSCGHQVSYREI